MSETHKSQYDLAVERMKRYVADAVIHNEPARNCGICEDIHALQNLVESLKIERSVLRTELKAWRSMPHLDHIIGTYWKHGEDYMDALTDAKQVTDTLGLLEDKQ